MGTTLQRPGAEIRAERDVSGGESSAGQELLHHPTKQLVCRLQMTSMEPGGAQIPSPAEGKARSCHQII